jgi:hypothetical protein
MFISPALAARIPGLRIVAVGYKHVAHHGQRPRRAQSRVVQTDQRPAPKCTISSLAAGSLFRW